VFVAKIITMNLSKKRINANLAFVVVGFGNPLLVFLSKSLLTGLLYTANFLK